MTALPVIGLSASHFQENELRLLFNGTPRTYAEGIQEAGGLPFMLPNIPELAGEYARQVDAVLFTGGADLHPHLYGDVPRRGLGATDERRDAFETALYRAVRELGKPAFGICRGFQLLNVMEGGTLHQNLPDVPDAWVDHSQRALPPEPGHPVTFEPDSLLGALYGKTALVNSYHHQALDRVGAGLRVVAHAPDGIPEAIEGDGLVGVQWHPEMMYQTRPYMHATFKAFLKSMA